MIKWGLVRLLENYMANNSPIYRIYCGYLCTNKECGKISVYFYTRHYSLKVNRFNYAHFNSIPYVANSWYNVQCVFSDIHSIPENRQPLWGGNQGNVIHRSHWQIISYQNGVKMFSMLLINLGRVSWSWFKGFYKLMTPTPPASFFIFSVEFDRSKGFKGLGPTVLKTK